MLKAVVGYVATFKSCIPTLQNGAKAMDSVPTTANTLYMLLVMPDTLGTCVAESELAGLLALFARCVIGNGLGAHPSEAGHDTLAKAVIAAYSEKHTAEDETDKYLPEDAVHS